MLLLQPLTVNSFRSCRLDNYSHPARKKTILLQQLPKFTNSVKLQTQTKQGAQILLTANRTAYNILINYHSMNSASL